MTDTPSRRHGAHSALLVIRYTEFLEGAVIDGIVIQPLWLKAHGALQRAGCREWP